MVEAMAHPDMPGDEIIAQFTGIRASSSHARAAFHPAHLRLSAFIRGWYLIKIGGMNEDALPNVSYDNITFTALSETIYVENDEVTQ